MKRLSLLLIPLLLPLYVRAEAEPEIDWDRIKGAAQRYLETCVPAEKRQKMSKEMNTHIEQRCQDTGSSADQAAREIMFDWAAGNQKKLKTHEPEAVAQVCFYFVSFMDKGFLISSQIRQSLTPWLVQKILDFLEDEIKKKKTAAAK